MGLQPPQSPKLVIFGINLPKKGIPLKRFKKNKIWLGGGSPRSAPACQISSFWLKEMWAYSLKNHNFWYKFARKGTFRGSTEKVKYRCATTNLPLCNDTISVLIITLLPLSQTSSFQSVTKTYKKHHTFSSSAGEQPTIPTILDVVTEEVRTIFCIPQLF